MTTETRKTETGTPATTALVAVRCSQHGGMRQRPLDRQTPEQKWCGVWWDCQDPRCHSSILFESEESRQQLAEQRASA